MADLPSETHKPVPVTDAHPGLEQPPPRDVPAPAAGTRPPVATPGEAQAPAWATNFGQAGRALTTLTALDGAIAQTGRTQGVMSDGAGHTFDIAQFRGQLTNSVESNLWKAVYNTDSGATGSAADIYNALRTADHYDARMTALGQDPQVLDALKKINISGDNLTPDKVQTAILQLGLAQGPNSDFANSDVGRKLTEYLTLNEAKSDSIQQAGQAQATNKAPALAALALAEYSLEHGNGVLAVRDKDGNVVNGTDGHPKAVTAAELLRMANDADMARNPAAQPIQSRAATAEAQLVSNVLGGDDKNPLVTLQDASLTHNLADYQRAYRQAQNPAFNPDNIQKLRDNVQQKLTAKQITDEQAQALNKGLDVMSHTRSLTEVQLGAAMLAQPNPDFNGALDHLKAGAADTTLVPGGVAAAQKLVDAARGIDQFKKDHPDLASVMADTAIGTQAAATFAEIARAVDILEPKDANGKLLLGPDGKKVPVSQADMIRARGLFEDAYAKGQQLSSMLEPNRQAIDSTYQALAQKQDRTAAEEAQLAQMKPLYNALHASSIAGVELGRLDAYTLDGHLAQHTLDDVAKDTSFFADSAHQQDLDAARALAGAAVSQQAGFLSTYGKWLGLGVAAFGATVATVASFGVGAIPAWAAVAAYGVSLGVGATVGAALETNHVPFLSPDAPGVAETWGQGFRDSIGPAFTGMTLGAAAPFAVASILPGAAAVGVAGEGVVATGVGTVATGAGTIATDAALGAQLSLDLGAAGTPAVEGLVAAATPGEAALATGAPAQLELFDAAANLGAAPAAAVPAQLELFDAAANLGAAPAAAAPAQLGLDLAGAAPGQAANLAGTGVRGLLGRGTTWFKGLPGVTPTIDAAKAVPSLASRYSGVSWLRAGLADVQAPAWQQTIDATVARTLGPRLANMGVRAVRWGEVGLVASLPTWQEKGFVPYLEQASMYPILGAVGTPIVGEGAGFLAKTGSVLAKTSILGVGDLGRHMLGEVIDPLTQSGHYWAHVGDRMQVDFMDEKTKGTLMPLMLFPAARWLIPSVEGSAVDTARAAALAQEQAELDAQRAEQARLAAQRAQPPAT